MTNQKHIYAFSTLVQMTKDLHASGKRIGITHGAFDLFHASHLDLFRKSSQLCDFLIVGVDSDVNVASYKSYKRPIIGERDRMSIINELHCVDAVFLNNTPVGDAGKDKFAQLYRDLSADVVLIGETFNFVPGVMAEAGKAQARLIKVNTKQYPISTSAIIETILNKYNEN